MQASQAVSSVARSRGRVRTRAWALGAAIGVAALLLGFATFAAFFVASYQPLEADPGGANSGVYGDVQKVGSFLPPGSAYPKPFVAYLAPYEDGRQGCR